MILLALGVLVIAGVYVWGRHKQKVLDFLQRRGEYDELGYALSADESSESAAAQPEEDEDTFDSLNYTGTGGREMAADRREPGFSGGNEGADADHAALAEPASSASVSQPAKPKPVKAGALGAPFLIQISVVAGRDRVFRGEDLRDALLELDLAHGSMGIFHRYDRSYRESLFSVASLVEPGTFPMFMDSFECPGVVLFFQPAQVSDPLAVFDDLVATCHELASRLGGIEWDETRQPLTPDKIAHMRALLEDACE
jgi:cell division protein ZipA